MEKHGAKVHLLAIDLKSAANCKKVADTAIEKMGRVNILVNNHATQMMKRSIADLSE